MKDFLDLCHLLACLFVTGRLVADVAVGSKLGVCRLASPAFILWVVGTGLEASSTA